jgi:hypothetical protein
MTPATKAGRRALRRHRRARMVCLAVRARRFAPREDAHFQPIPARRSLLGASLTSAWAVTRGSKHDDLTSCSMRHLARVHGGSSARKSADVLPDISDVLGQVPAQRDF